LRLISNKIHKLRGESTGIGLELLVSVKLKAALLLSALISGTCFAQVVIHEDVEQVEPDSLYVLINHPSSDANKQKNTKAAIQELARDAKDRKIPSVLVAESFDSRKEPIAQGGQYFLKSEDVTDLLQSMYGAHNLLFPNLRRMVFSGGNLELCLCEAIRDVSRGAQFGAKPIRFDLVTDAIYTFADDTKPVPITIPFSQMVSSMTDAQLTEFFETKIFRVGPNQFCGGQQSNMLHAPGDIKVSDFTIDLYNHHQKIARMGNGKKLLEVNLISLDEFKKEVPKSAVAADFAKAIMPDSSSPIRPIGTDAGLGKR
jgi:hypothetical protein